MCILPSPSPRVCRSNKLEINMLKQHGTGLQGMVGRVLDLRFDVSLRPESTDLRQINQLSEIPVLICEIGSLPLIYLPHMFT